MESQTENLWQNTTGRNIGNRPPLLATKTQPGNERFIENSLAGERKFQLHQIGSEADNNTKCGQSGAELIITGSDKTKCEEIFVNTGMIKQELACIFSYYLRVVKSSLF